MFGGLSRTLVPFFHFCLPQQNVATLINTTAAKHAQILSRDPATVSRSESLGDFWVTEVTVSLEFYEIHTWKKNIYPLRRVMVLGVTASGRRPGKMDENLSKQNLGGGFKYFCFHPETWGRWTQFDDHIFQMGWNHQLDIPSLKLTLFRTWNGAEGPKRKGIIENYHPFSGAKMLVSGRVMQKRSCLLC